MIKKVLTILMLSLICMSVDAQTVTTKDLIGSWKLIVEKGVKMAADIEMYITYAQELCEKMKSKEIILNEVVGEIVAIDWKKTRRVNKNLAVIKEYAREIYMKNNGKTLYDLFFAFSNYYYNYPRMRIDKLGDDKRFQFAMIKYNYELYDYHIKMLKFLN